jgi:hypothetical protein
MLTMRPSTPDGWEAVNRAYAAVKDFEHQDQVAAALSALRETRNDTPGVRTAFDRTREETPAYRTQQIEALRFTKAC